MRQHRSIMGMPVQLEIVDARATQENYDEIFEYFIQIDERYSTYKEESEISKINRGEVSQGEYSAEMKEVLRLCEETTQLTDGYFNIRKPDGLLDPSGLVKGWSINNAATLLAERGFQNFYLEIAGDVQTSGVNAEGKEWSIGVRNPFSREEVVKVVYPRGKGIATSGTYTQGDHIYNPKDLQVSPNEFVSLTVLGPNVYEADRYATAVFVMGLKGMHLLESLAEFEAYAIDHTGQAVMTSKFEEYTIR